MRNNPFRIIRMDFIFKGIQQRWNTPVASYIRIQNLPLEEIKHNEKLKFEEVIMVIKQFKWLFQQTRYSGVYQNIDIVSMVG